MHIRSETNVDESVFSESQKVGSQSKRILMGSNRKLQKPLKGPGLTGIQRLSCLKARKLKGAQPDARAA